MMIVWVALLIFWVSLVLIGVMLYREPGVTPRESLATYRFGNYWFSVDYLKIFTKIRTQLKKVQRFWKRIVVMSGHSIVERIHRTTQKHVEILKREE